MGMATHAVRSKVHDLLILGPADVLEPVDALVARVDNLLPRGFIPLVQTVHTRELRLVVPCCRREHPFCVTLRCYGCVNA